MLALVVVIVIVVNGLRARRGSETGGEREGGAQAHALVAVEEQRGGLARELRLEPELRVEQVLQRGLTLAQLRLQPLHALVDAVHLVHQPARAPAPASELY